jgi:hypothetical protein
MWPGRGQESICPYVCYPESGFSSPTISESDALARIANREADLRTTRESDRYLRVPCRQFSERRANSAGAVLSNS